MAEHSNIASKSKKAFLNLLVASISVLLTLSFCELGIRLFFKNKIVLFPRFQTKATYGEYQIRRMRPHYNFWHTSIDGVWSFKTNRQGFRDNFDFSYEKSRNTLRILVLGDSQTLGFEVRNEYTYSRIIEKYLNSHGIKAEVYNTGMSGFGTAEELAYLENEGIKYKPDIVILGFYANDFEDNVKAGMFRVQDDKLIAGHKIHLPGVRVQDALYRIPFIRWLSQHSYFYSLLFNVAWEKAKNMAYSKKRTALLTEYAIPEGKLDNYMVSLAQKLLERIYDLCNSRNIRFMILDIPLQGRPDISTKVKQISGKACDIYVDGNQIVSDLSKYADVNVPHGQHHISEFTHIALGQSISETIIAIIRK